MDGSSKTRNAIAARKPDHAWPDTYQMLSRALEMQGRLREALVEMRNVFYGGATGLENSPAAWLEYGKLSEKLKHTDEAMLAYRNAAIATRNTNYDFSRLLTGKESFRELKALAYGAVGSRQEFSPDGQALIIESIQLNDSIGLTHLIRGQYLRRKDPEQAIQEINKAIKFGDSLVKENANLLKGTIWIPSDKVKETLRLIKEGVNPPAPDKNENGVRR